MEFSKNSSRIFLCPVIFIAHVLNQQTSVICSLFSALNKRLPLFSNLLKYVDINYILVYNLNVLDY